MAAPRSLIVAASAIALAACAQPGERANPQDAFWDALSSHCGKAYEGALTSTDAADAGMQGAQMIMHVRDCTDDTIRVPFHVKPVDGDWDRSRNWVFTRTEGGLRLKHDHRHEDGTSDAVTMYGGDSANDGTATAQVFPVDQESIAMFKREGLDASVTNVWRVRVDPAGSKDATFRYRLTRKKSGGAPEDRDFTVSFDLTKPVAPPPVPWGF